MKNWSFKVNTTPQQSLSKLESEMSSISGFVFNVDSQEDTTSFFKLRRRIHDGEKILHYNLVIVNGKISKTNNENNSKVEITFKQHLLVTFTKSILYGLALVAIIAGIVSRTTMLIPGLILVVFVISIWAWMNVKSEKYIKEYKTLLSEFFEVA